MRRTNDTTTTHLAALAGFLLAAVAWTWPLGRHLGSRFTPDPGDPILNIWILWWNTQAIPFTERWWNPPVFSPMEGALALSEHLAGIAIVTTPLQLAGASPLAAYNVAVILSFALSGFFAYLLVHYLLARHAAPPFTAVSITAGALCAGVAFGFAPYRAGHLSHLQVLTTQWLPLALLAMHAYLDGGRRRWLAVLGFAWVVQALSNGYYLLFFPVLAALWLAWFVDWRRQWRRGVALLGAYAASSLLLVPGLLQYLAVHRQFGLARRLDEMRMFSADLTAFAAIPGALAFWPDGTHINHEAYLFPGLTIVILILLAVGRGFMPRLTAARHGPPSYRSAFAFYALAALVMFWLAFGPALPDDPIADRFRLYTLLTWLPGYEGLRVPTRFAMLGFLCLAVAAGVALARLLPARPAARAAVVAAVFAGLFVDTWIVPVPLVAPPGRIDLPGMPGALVLEMPPDDGEVSVAAMYRSMAHGYPLANGYSGHVPPHYRILTNGLRRGDPSILTALARRRPLLVSIDPRRDEDGHFRRVVESIPGVEPLGATSAGRLFLVPAQPAGPGTPPGERIPHTLTEPAHDIAQLDLGSVRWVRMLELAVGGYYLDLHSRLEIRASEDGETWTTVWLDWTGAPALLGALEDQRHAPMRLTLPDVRARYLRVRPLPAVLMEEIIVYGPR